MKYSEKEKTAARELLLTLLKPGDTVYTIVRHITRSNTAYIGIVVFKDGYVSHPNHAASVLLGRSYNHPYSGVMMTGGGYDKADHLVEDLSHYLFGSEGQLRQESL